MRHAVTTLVQPTEDTLATWVSSLGVDSPCFCCGFPLDNLSVDTTANTGRLSLSCSHCGAGVSGDEDPFEDMFTLDAVLEDRWPALVAA